MRRLLIDIGNSRIKWVFTDGSEFHGLVQALPIAQTSKLFARWHADGDPRPAQVRLVSVTDHPAVASIMAWIKRHWGLDAERVATLSKSNGITVAYAKPEQLGADRWLAMIGAHARGLLPACVIDCGSAITIDAVDQAGQHYGGLILPGVAAQQLGLAQLAPGLPSPNLENVAPLLAKNPPDAVLSGFLNGTAAALQGLIERIGKQTGLPLKPVLTGGDSQRLNAYFSDAAPVYPDLVLEGLAALE